MLSRSLPVFLLVAAPAASQDVPKAAIKPNARVAIVGDSITEQRLYSKYVADYLYACQPQLNAHVVQFGWSGERAAGFAARVDNDLMPFRPDVVTTCYGMNDGSYTKYTDAIGAAYEKPMREFVGKLKKANATVIVGGPGAVDQYFFKRGKEEKVSAFSGVYNENLATLSGIARKIAADNGFPHADVHGAMHAVMLAAQAKYGDKYPVCGGDGFHPGPNGQLVMAYAFLKAMKLDGDLGTITVDFKGESTAANGHAVTKAEGGTVTVESKRYPFCFTGPADSAGGTRSIAPFLPFNDEFNRLTLVVKNAPADKLTVTWGKESHPFTKAELEKGVNLAAAFADHPLAAAFAAVDAKVADQQAYQTAMVKQVITNFRAVPPPLAKEPEVAAALTTVRDRRWAEEAAKHEAVRAAVKPVTHTIVVKAAE
jgi:lysophospholipase L1-like esterase